MQHFDAHTGFSMMSVMPRMYSCTHAPYSRGEATETLWCEGRKLPIYIAWNNFCYY